MMTRNSLTASLFVLLFPLLLTASQPSRAQQRVERWGCFELSLPAAVQGNPFEVALTATFTCGAESQTVRGFYDGDGVFKVRFMPGSEGEWSYVTASRVPALNRRRGSFVCAAPSEGNHGPVEPDGRHFRYADGTRYYPVGTTAYDWMHVGDEAAARTVASMLASGFNKLRMLFFLHNLPVEYPDIYPFVRKADGSWDYERFDPAYFQYVERRILALQAIDVEADLVLFHPYDGGRWGFDRMPLEANLRYLSYITARFSAFRNIWWSLANEWDGVKGIPAEDWDKFAAAVAAGDPYRHLLSIHGYTATYYNYFDPVFTHASIQDHGPVMERGRAHTVSQIYKKPVIFDEVCYEGNVGSRWGWLSGQEMLRRMYNGLMSGTYVTHAETFNDEEGSSAEVAGNYLAYGGDFRGESWRRIKFLRAVLDELPNPLGLADHNWDEYTATAGDGYYLIYLGNEIRGEWTFDLPVKNGPWARPQAGEKYRVEILDTWNMTVTPWPVVFETAAPGRYRIRDKEGRAVRLPDTPYLLLRIKKIQ